MARVQKILVAETFLGRETGDLPRKGNGKKGSGKPNGG